MRSMASLRHPTRPKGYASFGTPLWQSLFESMDPSHTEAPMEFRHPFVDLRLLRYMLAVPPMPWCRRKHLIREAMREILPDEVLDRDKSPLQSDPVFQAARRFGIPPLIPTRELLKYVNPHEVHCRVPEEVGRFWLTLRPAVLNHWLEFSNVAGS